MEGNCTVEGAVDFGKGPVLVRCTEVGSHTKHICQVEIEVAESKSVPKNIFDPKDEDFRPLGMQG